MRMATDTIRDELIDKKDSDSVDDLIKKQDWLNQLRSVWISFHKPHLQDLSNPDLFQDVISQKKHRDHEFLTICHGEPWIGNVHFKTNPSTPEGDDVDGQHAGGVTEALFSGFHSCTVSRPGFDLAHFLMTSTTREFRDQNLRVVLDTYLSELDDVLSSQGT